MIGKTTKSLRRKKMGEYTDAVERQRLLLAAEERRDTVINMHMHRLKSMWYDNRPQDTDEGSVTDITYMDGRIERTLLNGDKVLLVEGKTGDDLIQEVSKNLVDAGEKL